MARNSPKTSASGGAASAQPAPRRLCARPIGNGLPTYVLRGICRRRIRKRRRNLRTRHAAADVFPAFGSASGARTRQNANEFAFAPDLFVPLRGKTDLSRFAVVATNAHFFGGGGPQNGGPPPTAAKGRSARRGPLASSAGCGRGNDDTKRERPRQGKHNGSICSWI